MYLEFLTSVTIRSVLQFLIFFELEAVEASLGSSVELSSVITSLNNKSFLSQLLQYFKVVEFLMHCPDSSICPTRKTIGS